MTKHAVLYREQGANLLEHAQYHALWQQGASDSATPLSVVEAALDQDITHLWVYPEMWVASERIGSLLVPQGPEWSVKPSYRHGKLATVSMWKRGTGHINVIFPHNGAWNPIIEGVTAKELLGALFYLQSNLGVPVTGSPGGTGWNLVKSLHPEWIESIPVDLREMHFTAKAGGDLVWQHEDIGRLCCEGLYVHKFDKGAAYPAAATQTDIGTGTPIHTQGLDAELASYHVNGHPQDVGVWRCTIQYDGDLYNPDLPPVWKENKGSYASGATDEGVWLAGPIIRLLRSLGHTVKVHEAYIFPQRHDLLVKWGRSLWSGRERLAAGSSRYEQIAARMMKQIANSTIGFTAYKGFEPEEDEKRRPDIRLQVVSRNREIMSHNIRKFYKLAHEFPCMAYMDALYYFSRCEDGRAGFTFSKVVEREGKLGGFRWEGRIKLTDDIGRMFAKSMSVAERLEHLNKIGWKK